MALAKIINILLASAMLQLNFVLRLRTREQAIYFDSRLCYFILRNSSFELIHNILRLQFTKKWIQDHLVRVHTVEARINDYSLKK